MDRGILGNNLSKQTFSSYERKIAIIICYIFITVKLDISSTPNFISNK